MREECGCCTMALQDGESQDFLWTPCCSGWFHRDCVQQTAENAGTHFFKCPLCNNKKDFTEEMLKVSYQGLLCSVLTPRFSSESLFLTETQTGSPGTPSMTNFTATTAAMLRAAAVPQAGSSTRRTRTGRSCSASSAGPRASMWSAAGWTEPGLAGSVRCVNLSWRVCPTSPSRCSPESRGLRTLRTNNSPGQSSTI